MNIIELAREVGVESDLTPSLLKELFLYDDGVLRWKVSLSNRGQQGTVAGSIDGNGYTQIMINGKRYKAHRLIYLMFNGALPAVIDHRNGVRNDNRIENLRAATLSGNASNAKTKAVNTSGAKNVFWHKRRGKWYVAVSQNNKSVHCGYFENFDDAKQAAAAARAKFYGEFANHE